MQLSTKSRYGTRAAIEIARSYGIRPVKRREIVETQEVADSYLENILVALRSAGLIQAIRGAKGGYQLTRPPKEITVFDVVSALENTIAPLSCLDTGDSCERSSRCLTRPIWTEMYDAMKDVLSSYTLQDIIDKERDAVGSDYVI